jgi:translation initiation factor 5B
MPPPKKSVGGIAAIKAMMAEKKAAEEEAKRLEEEERRRVEEEEQKLLELQRQEEEAKAAKKEKERLKKESLRKQGKLLSKSEKEKQERNKMKLEQLRSSGLLIATVGEDPEIQKKKPIYSNKKKKQSKEEPAEQEKKEAREEVEDDWEKNFDSFSSSEDEKASDFNEIENSNDDSELEELQQDLKRTDIGQKDQHNLRSPICCILGHVDTGKTKLLDKIRQTNVQEGEAGGITQQIGATFFPISAIEEKTSHLFTSGAFVDLEYRVPGLLVIDTPGHESFTNLRSRGSSLCNIAILVVDIMHNLEAQTLESIGLLKQRKTPFIVALNKVDRLYGWKSIPNIPFEELLEKQDRAVKNEFETRAGQVISAFSEQGLNAELFFRNDDLRRCVSLVPTSAITGDGIPDLLVLLISLTQKMMSDDLKYISSQLECTVLEVKVIEGLGTTIDVILSNGVLREGDKIAICGLNGPIITQVRALLTPQTMKELRVKSQYVHNKIVRAALGVKICAPDLEKAIAGSSLQVIGKKGLSEEDAKQAVMKDLDDLLASVDKSGKGVYVQASTLGSLEALLSFLKDSKIPVAGIGIGPVHKKDIVKASVMVDLAKEYACLLAFDVKIEKEAEEIAHELEVKIFRADIIYHLFDQFTAYMNDLIEQKKRDMAPQAVFPCILNIVPGCVFNKRSPLVIGVDIAEGILRVGTPLVAIPRNSKGPGDHVTLGRVSSIELNHKPMQSVRKGSPSVAIKIDCASYEAPRMFGRHFTESDELVSKVSRDSIDILKSTFRDAMEKEDWGVVIKLKKYFNIQ